jgi:GH24 family phage-related lysozyme (muramidase)
MAKWKAPKDFIDYIIDVEGSRKTKGRHYPYPSAEGGSDTVGYGHKIKRGENFSKGLSEEEARALLDKDLQKASNDLKSSITNANWDKLDNKRKEMLVAYQFNLGNVKAKFPKFTQAVIQNDKETMVKEYARTYKTPEGQTLSLQRSDDLFYDRYLSDTGPRQIGPTKKKKSVTIMPEKSKTIGQTPMPEQEEEQTSTQGTPEDAFSNIDQEAYFANSEKSKKALEADYRRFVAKATVLLHTPAVTKNVVKSLSSGSSVEKVGDVTYAVVDKVSEAMRKEGQSIPDEVLAVATSYIMPLVVEIGEASGLEPMPQDEQEAALSHTVNRYINSEVQKGRIDPKKLAEENGRSVQQMSPEQRAQIDEQMKRIDAAARRSVQRGDPLLRKQQIETEIKQELWPGYSVAEDSTTGSGGLL